MLEAGAPSQLSAVICIDLWYLPFGTLFAETREYSVVIVDALPVAREPMDVLSKPIYQIYEVQLSIP